MKVKNVVQKLQADKLLSSKTTKKKEDGGQVVDNSIISGDTSIGVTKKAISGVKKFDNQAATKEQLGERLRNAVADGDIEAIKALVKQGSDINAKDNYGYTPLHWAAVHDKAEAIKELVKHGADINAKGNKGRTPLHDAAIMGHAEAIKALINLGAKDDYGQTPMLILLHDAEKFDNAEAVQVLRALGHDSADGWLIAKA